MDVLRGCLVEVVVDVGERVLLDVGNANVLMVVNFTRCWNEFAGQDVDESGFACAVGADDGDARAERTLEGDVGELRLGRARVLE